MTLKRTDGTLRPCPDETTKRQPECSIAVPRFRKAGTVSHRIAGLSCFAGPGCRKFQKNKPEPSRSVVCGIHHIRQSVRTVHQPVWTNLTERGKRDIRSEKTALFHLFCCLTAMNPEGISGPGNHYSWRFCDFLFSPESIPFGKHNESHSPFSRFRNTHDGEKPYGYRE